jgi:hypothetical protein
MRYIFFLMTPTRPEVVGKKVDIRLGVVKTYVGAMLAMGSLGEQARLPTGEDVGRSKASVCARVSDTVNGYLVILLLGVVLI